MSFDPPPPPITRLPGTAFELVAAVSENDAIGRDGRLPWHLRRDLRYFKALTLNKVVLMGRKTFESIGGPLAQRVNFVLSRDPEFSAPGCVVVTDIAAVLERGWAPEGPVMVIGGAAIYALCVAHAQRIHLTLVHTVVPDADAFFGLWRGAEWSETRRIEHPADEQNDFRFSLLTLDRSVPAERARKSA